jgi:hypothetical protein
MEMITPETFSPVRPREPAAEPPPSSLDATPHCCGDPERAGSGPVEIAQARESIPRQKALAENPRTVARLDPHAEPLAGSLAGPIARSSSGGSSPLVRPAHARGGVAE